MSMMKPRASATGRPELADLRRELIDDEFCRIVVDGAERALIDAANPLRCNFFSTAMRMLFEHVMDTLAPASEVERCSWFKPETQTGRPSRAQRVLFAVQGGFPERFVKQTLKVDVQPLRKRLLLAVDELSKHVHGREATMLRGAAAQDKFVQETVAAMTEFLVAMRECREAILEPVEEALDDEAVSALVTETISDIDELATHHSVEDIEVEHVTVYKIGHDTITYRATGSIYVTLQWGSNSDVRRGDGAELDESFPFYVDMVLPLDEPWDMSYAETNYGVDAREWRGDPDEC
jgi:hypothetical protein